MVVDMLALVRQQNILHRTPANINRHITGNEKLVRGLLTMKLFAVHIHHNENCWADAPNWAIELREQINHLRMTLMAAIDDLTAAVAAEDTVIDSAVTLLNGIPALIAAAGTDPAKLAALQSDITTRTTALSAAVLANTPTPAASAAPVTPAAATAAATKANA